MLLLQGCRKLLQGGGANGAAKLGGGKSVCVWGGGKLGLKVGSFKQN